mmetsp:Transcript_75585/g.127121  ORF Transcript_75585/g.127121 Transcript_75585/m.127121 type:complete len:244 (+) Transcript_75585:134-865(+)
MKLGYHLLSWMLKDGCYNPSSNACYLRKNSPRAAPTTSGGLVLREHGSLLLMGQMTTVECAENITSLLLVNYRLFDDCSKRIDTIKQTNSQRYANKKILPSPHKGALFLLPLFEEKGRASHVGHGPAQLKIWSRASDSSVRSVLQVFCRDRQILPAPLRQRETKWVYSQSKGVSQRIIVTILLGCRLRGKEKKHTTNVPTTAAKKNVATNPHNHHQGDRQLHTQEHSIQWSCTSIQNPCPSSP